MDENSVLIKVVLIVCWWWQTVYMQEVKLDQQIGIDINTRFIKDKETGGQDDWEKVIL